MTYIPRPQSSLYPSMSGKISFIPEAIINFRPIHVRPVRSVTSNLGVVLIGLPGTSADNLSIEEADRVIFVHDLLHGLSSI